MMNTISVPKISYGLGYTLSMPTHDTDDLPLLVYLHGAGERGTDLSHISRNAIPRLISEGRDFPALILCPQCPAEYVWDNIVDQVKALIDKIVAQYEIKKDRICLTGSSMGGFGTVAMAMTYRSFFSAIAPVAGGGMVWRCNNLLNTPVYAVHGEQDDIVPYICSQMLVDALRELGATVLFKLLPQRNHTTGIESAYEETDLIPWLLRQRRTNLPSCRKPSQNYSEDFYSFPENSMTGS